MSLTFFLTVPEGEGEELLNMLYLVQSGRGEDRRDHPAYLALGK